jgi:hypothetical protein
MASKHAEYMRKWREKNALHCGLYVRKRVGGNTEEHRKNKASYREKHPDRHLAGKILRNAVRSKISKPDHCTRCGLICNPEGHHEDYSKPLEVLWLCRPCHCKAYGRKMRIL